MEMAHDTAFWDDFFSLYNCFWNLSNFKLMDFIQSLLVFLSGSLALVFILSKYVLKKKSAKDSDCGSDCGCH
jgi:hypothetical protein